MGLKAGGVLGRREGYGCGSSKEEKASGGMSRKTKLSPLRGQCGRETDTVLLEEVKGVSKRRWGTQILMMLDPGF